MKLVNLITSLCAVSFVWACAAEDASDNGDEAEADVVAASSDMPGPACSGSGLQVSNADRFAVDASVAIHPLLANEAGLPKMAKVASGARTRWQRACTVVGGRKACDGWKVASESPTFKPDFYLARDGAGYSLAFYSEERFSDARSGVVGTGHYLAAAKSVSSSKFRGFTTRPARYYAFTNVAGQGENRTEAAYVGTVRTACAKFWRTSKFDEVVSGSSTKYTEFADVLFAGF